MKIFVSFREIAFSLRLSSRLHLFLQGGTDPRTHFALVGRKDDDEDMNGSRKEGRKEETY